MAGQVSITIGTPAAVVRSNASSSITPSWNHTPCAPTATAWSANSPAARSAGTRRPRRSGTARRPAWRSPARRARACGASGWIGTIRLPRCCSSAAIRYAVRTGCPRGPTTAQVSQVVEHAVDGLGVLPFGHADADVADEPRPVGRPVDEGCTVTTIRPCADFPLYALSEEHQAIREAVRAVCDAKVAPFAADGRRGGPLPAGGADALLAADFHAPHVPEEYGGAGADALATVLVIEEVARACVELSLIPAVNKLGSLPGADRRRRGAQEEVPRPARGRRGRLLLLPLRARRRLRRGRHEDHAPCATATTGCSTA